MNEKQLWWDSNELENWSAWNKNIKPEKRLSMYVYFKLVCVGQFFGFFSGQGKSLYKKKKLGYLWKALNLCMYVQ